MAKHKTLAFFIPHIGCPHRCSFCDQRTITGNVHAPTPAEVADTCREMLSRHDTLESAEIAFFGGSFTAVPVALQEALLQAAQPFLGVGKFQGIRISTRPDAIDGETLDRLNRYHVTAIELGAQSMADAVLAVNERGHTAQDVRSASAQIRSAGFSLGLQQMVGLYGSTLADEYHTLSQLLACQPDTLRIYPTVILEGTKLAAYYRSGAYIRLSWEDVLDYCADALCRCQNQGVRVIRLGLHDTPSLAEHRVAGFYHPAFRELVESRLYRRALEQALPNCDDAQLLVETAPGTTSQVIGHQGCNRNWLAELGKRLVVRESPAVAVGTLRVAGSDYSWQERRPASDLSP